MSKKATQNVKAFMECWKLGDPKDMLVLCNQTYRVQHTFRNIRSLFQAYPLESYRMGKATKVSEVMYDVTVKVTTSGKETTIKARTISELAPWKPSVDGDFGVNPLSIIRWLS